MHRPGPGFVPFLGGPQARLSDFSPFPTKRQHELAEIVEAVCPAWHRKPNTHAPRKGRPAWAIEAAYWYDLCGVSNAEVADRLEYVDREQDYRKRSRSADRIVGIGRRTLDGLGAWPWAVAENGVLPKRWFEQEPFALALSVWHREASKAALNDALIALDAVVAPQEWRFVPERVRLADDTYKARVVRTRGGD